LEENIMKKIIAITLAVLMAAITFIFAGCGDKKTATDSDLEYVKNNGKLVIGITDFDPMDYKDANGEWIGFDADLARKVCEKLGVTAEFKVITWGQKENELNTKSIDAIWNGMTITDAIKNVADVSGAYMTNYQVVVVKDAKYTTVESLAGQTIVAEQGSAGESAIQANATLSKSYKPVESQSDALLQVQSGQAAACVIDYVMAGSMLVEGKTYSNLSIMKDVKLGDDESYGIAFRKGSDIVAAVNTAISELVADGTVKTIAEKYGLQDSIVTNFQATK
jgi:polar amino acid transport system substrate-binding protein